MGNYAEPSSQRELTDGKNRNDSSFKALKAENRKLRARIAEADRLLTATLFGHDVGFDIKDYLHRSDDTSALTTPTGVSEAWPNGCRKPNSCSRNKACVYIPCRHENRDITGEIDAAIAALPAAPEGGE